MAKAILHEESAAGTSNVVRLSTAAARRVKQPRLSRKYYRAKDELPKHPAKWLAPWQRQALNDAVLIGQAGEDSLRLIILAMFKVMGPLDQAKVLALVGAQYAKLNGPPAFALLQSQTATVGEVSGLQWAARYIEENGLPS